MRRAALVLSILASAPGAAVGQEALEDQCQPVTGLVAECRLAASAIRTAQPRIGVALWGGSPVPGTASTLGMRIGSMPRISVSGRVTLVPTTLLPLADRTTNETETGWIPGVSTQAVVGVLPGWSPLPTVGGVLSLDAIGRLSFAALPGSGFRDDHVWGWMLGLRLGALRESFTLPGVSLTASYGGSTEITYGDPENASTDGFWEGSMTDLNATLAVTKALSALRLTGGAAFDRYSSDVRVGYRTSRLSPQVVFDADSDTDRWSGFVNASWTLLIFHASAEVGLQQTVEPKGLPTGVEADPIGWWGGLAFRISI